MANGVDISWESVNLTDFLPSELSEAVDELGPAVETLQGFIDSVATALELIGAAIIADVDVLRAALAAVSAVLDAALEFVFNTSVRMTYIVPRAYRNRTSVRDLLSQLSRSYNDESDPNRPVEDGPFVLWAVFYSSTNVAKVLSKVSGLMDFFGLPIELTAPAEDSSFLQELLDDPDVDADRFLRKLSGDAGHGLTPKAEDLEPILPEGGGRAPNWSAISLSDIGVIGDIANLLKATKDSLLPLDGLAGWFQTMVGIVRDRVTRISAYVADLVSMLDEFAVLSLTVEGLGSLVLDGNGDPSVQQRALIEAAQHKDFPYGGIHDLEYAACLVVYFAASSNALVDTMKNLLGVGNGGTIEESTERAGIISEQAEIAVKSINKTPKQGMEDAI